MAKQKVRGHRANKPNDSFGTVNNDTLYKGKYREEVYEDDEDNTELEASEEVEQDAEQPVAAEEAETFGSKPESKEPDYKKRYDDLKRHYDERLAEWKQEKDEFVTRLNTSSKPQVADDTSELGAFKDQYPDVYDAIHKISSSQSEARVQGLEQELSQIKEREKALEKQKAYQELLRLQPDFEEMKDDESFNKWLQDQPTSISDGVYNNSTDAHWASRVVDLYKADSGLSKKTASKPKQNKKADAAMSVSRTSTKEVGTGEGEKRVWKASEIAKMKPWEFEKMETELDAARAEGRINFNS
jgi:hypothetical protein